jgi:hypothetical protein
MAEQWIPKNKAELMSAIEKEWKLLIQVAEKITDKQMTTPDEGGWSPKDNLAHLSEWMNALMGYHLDRHPRHEALRLPEDVTKDWDFDIINPALFERNRNRSRQDVIDELKAVYKKMHAKLDSMSWDDFMKPRHDDDPEKRPVLMWVLGDTNEHFLEHRETIEKGIKEN